MYVCTAVEMYKLICLGDRGDKEDMSQMQMRFKFNNINIYMYLIEPQYKNYIFAPQSIHATCYM